MKNITVSVDEDTHRQARIRAAELDTSVSALVRQFLRSLSESGPGVDMPAIPNKEGADVTLRPRDLDEVLADFNARGVGLQMSDNLSREDIYDRDRARMEAETQRRRGH